MTDKKPLTIDSFIEALEHQDQWEKEFHWDFGIVYAHYSELKGKFYHYDPPPSSCKSVGCAMGLAKQLWPEEFPDDPYNLSDVLGLPPYVGNRIFWRVDNIYPTLAPTPGMVAAALRRYKAGEPL